MNSMQACWTVNLEEFQAYFKTDVSALDEELLEVVHSPMGLRRDFYSAAQEPDLVDEAAVLSSVVGPDAAIDYLLVALVDRSGTGKSHFLRWLHRQIKLQQDDRLVVRYFPREMTTLRSIALCIFDDDDPEVEALRQPLIQGEIADRSEADLTIEMLAQIKIALRHAAQWNGVGDDPLLEIASDHGDALATARTLCGPVENLITSRAFEPRIHDEGSPIRRSIMGLREDGRVQAAPQFEPDDLRLTEAMRRELDERTRNEYANHVEGNLALAAAVANLALARCRARVALVNADAFRQNLNAYRQKLSREGKSLILIFEDFSQTMGLKQHLLEEFELEGAGYCPMGMIIATTSGPAEKDIRNSTKSRAASNPWSCVITLTPDSGSEVGFMGLVARYLNVARVGRAAAVADASKNACTNCEHREPCHDVFGSHDGIGVFPLSRASILAAQEALATTEEGATARTVLLTVIKPTLLQAPAALKAGTFPLDAEQQGDHGDALATLLRKTNRHLDPTQRAVVEALARGDARMAARLQALLLHWGVHDDEHLRMPDLLGFPSELLEAPEADGTVDVAEPDQDRPDPPREEDHVIAFVRRWAAGENLRAEGSAATEMRKIAHDLLKTLPCWEELILLNGKYWEGADAIDGCCAQLVGSTPHGIHNSTVALSDALRGQPLCSFQRDAAGQGELEALVRWHRATPMTDDEREASMDRVCIGAVRFRAEREVRRRLSSHSRTVVEEHRDALAGLSYLAPAGQAGEGRLTHIAPLATADVIALGGPPVSPDAEPAWRAAVEEGAEEFARLSNEILRLAGRAQGTGDVSVVDPGLSGFETGQPGNLRPPLAAAVLEQVEAIEAQVGAIAAVSGGETLEAVQAAIEQTNKTIDQFGTQPLKDLLDAAELNLSDSDDTLLAQAAAVTARARDTGLSHSTVFDLRLLDPQITRIANISDALRAAAGCLRVEADAVIADVRENDQMLQRGAAALKVFEDDLRAVRR